MSKYKAFGGGGSKSSGPSVPAPVIYKPVESAPSPAPTTSQTEQQRLDAQRTGDPTLTAYLSATRNTLLGQ